MKRQFYDEVEVEEILKLAASKSSPMKGMSRQNMLAAAAELGIPVEAVEDAEREFLHQRQEDEERRAFNKEFKGEFYGHLLTYVLVNTGLVIWNLVSQGRLTFAAVTMLIWGFFLVIHFFEAFNPHSEEYKKSFRKWRSDEYRKRRSRERAIAAESSAGGEEELQQRLAQGS
jgi:hypothetical protein